MLNLILNIFNYTIIVFLVTITYNKLYKKEIEIYECKCIMCCPTNENIQKYNQKIINY